jgi:hypothetical protein
VGWIKYDQVMRKSLSVALLSLLALTGCASGEAVDQDAAPLAAEQVAVKVPTIRQGDFLTEVKAALSSETSLNDIQLLAAGYEACLKVNEGNKDAYREKVLAGARNLEAGLDQLVIAAGAKALLCP